MAQRWLGFSAKAGCLFGAFWMVVQCLWGLVGLWTDKIGYHHGMSANHTDLAVSDHQYGSSISSKRPQASSLPVGTHTVTR